MSTDNFPTQSLLVERDGTGDCFQTAIATVLRIPKSTVPPFHDEDLFAMEPEDATPTRLYWQQAFLLWLDWLGYELEFIHHPLGKDLDDEDFPMWWIAGGESPRGAKDGHAVVWGREGMIHDPHPSQAGLFGTPKEFWILQRKEDDSHE